MRTAHCIKCYKEYHIEKFYEHLRAENIKIAYCDDCKSVVKPDIVFFGENLPDDFFIKSNIVNLNLIY